MDSYIENQLLRVQAMLGMPDITVATRGMLDDAWMVIQQRNLAGVHPLDTLAEIGEADEFTYYEWALLEYRVELLMTLTVHGALCEMCKATYPEVEHLHEVFHITAGHALVCPRCAEEAHPMDFEIVVEASF